jgi:predicted glutamine amidotransferase
MCEILALRAEQPFSLLKAVPYVSLLERYGLAGWGWGVSWLGERGIETYKSLGRVNQLDGTEASLLDTETRVCLFHLRRPSLMSGMKLENTQPFSPETKHLAFVHNGFLAGAEEFRRELSSDLTGTVDSEIGFRLYMRYLNSCDEKTALSKTLEETRGDGDANVVVLNQDGSFVAAGRNSKNRMFRFTSDQFTGILTEVHSPDDYVFDYLLPWIRTKEQITDPIHF